eukprot:3190258-Rhodomonas_salina.2
MTSKANPLPAYALAMRFPSAIRLRACYPKPGTALASASGGICVRGGTDVAYAASSAYALATRSPVLIWRPMAHATGTPPTPTTSGTSLRACYAMSGTDEAYATICLRACYAMPGTDIGYAAMCLRACYAKPGSDNNGGQGLGPGRVLTARRRAHSTRSYQPPYCPTHSLRHVQY